MSEEIKNNQIPEEIKEICRSCEENIHCQNKGCAFRSLGNEYCDYVLNATKLYLDLQQKVEQLEKENKELKYDCSCSFHDAEELNQKLTEIIDERNELDTKLIQLENIRKEAIEWCKCVINSKTTAGELPNGKRTDMGYCLDLAEPLLKILEWGKDER